MKINPRVLFLVWLVMGNAHASYVIHACDFVPLEQMLKQADKNTLVIFDVDYVLIMPTDESTINRHPYRKKLWKEIENRQDKEQVRVLYGAIRAKTKWRLVDPRVLSIFKFLKEHRIPTIALTSIFTGKSGVIKKIEDWRIKQLKSFGFDFLSLSPIKQNIYMKNLEVTDGIPMMKEGVILTAHIDKGKVLESILKRAEYLPKKIVFIDDDMLNIKSLEKLAYKLGVEFFGVHYTAVSKMPEPIINEKIEKLRFQILEEEGEWLDYGEVYKRSLTIGVDYTSQE